MGDMGDKHDQENLEAERFADSFLIGKCPVCDSHHAMDCSGMPEIDDPTMGFCPECSTFWCLECAVILEKDQKGCDHWTICDNCNKKDEEGICKAHIPTWECQKIIDWRNSLPSSRVIIITDGEDLDLETSLLLLRKENGEEN